MMVWEQTGKQTQNKTSEERSCNDFEVASSSIAWMTNWN